MSRLFEPAKIQQMSLPNRFVRSATYDGCAAETGHVTEKQLQLFAALAEGGTGLIVTGIAYVHPLGQISPFQNSIADDDCIPGLRQLTDSVHERGAKIAVQLFHAGREAAGFLKTKNQQAMSASVLPDDPYFKRPCRSMRTEEIETVIESFADAAQRARQAGFDAVQLHGAHAYLLSQFLSPYTNRRADEWGGSLANRLRFHQEIYKAIRQKVGPAYPVLIKIGVADGFAGGLTAEEGKMAAGLLAQEGYDALEISQGLRGKPYEETEFRTRINRPEREAYFRDWCKAVKANVDVPVMMVGGLRSLSLMAAVLENQEADFISLCRPLIKEPGIVGLWQSGNPRQPTCISCNQCYEALRKGKPLHCVQENKEKKDQQKG